MRILTVRHVTSYTYSEPVRFGEHHMMFRPRESHDLRLLTTKLDILPPPAYVIEAYLEATLVLQEPSKASAHKARLAKLHKEFDERQAFWKKSVRTDPMVSLEETVSFAAGFLLPPMMERSFNLLWKPGGPWTA